jgi:hypothetical protein
VLAVGTDATTHVVEAGTAGLHRAVASATADGDGGQLGDSARLIRSSTASAAPDLPPVALDNASRCPHRFGQPARELTSVRQFRSERPILATK